MLLNKSSKYYYSSIFLLLCFACASSLDLIDQSAKSELENQTTNFKVLALGDSYTIGESVCEDCKFPKQLVDSLEVSVTEKYSFPLKIIARTGWTTTNLISAIQSQNIDTDYSLATLLIGVNNQYQGLDFSVYEEEFPFLVDIALTALQGDKNKLIVVSIPDYAYTPFGRGNSKISEEIDSYNAYAKSYCDSQHITYINITDITRNGFINPNLVANDGLHPSELAYTEFVKRILPVALEKIQF